MTAATWHVLSNCTRAILEDGSSYWPERWPIEALLKRKAELDAIDLRSFSSEYLNIFLPSETQMYHPEAWPKWAILPKGLRYYQAWDLAISTKATADYTVGVCIGIDANQDVYLIDCRRNHWDFEMTQKEIAKLGRLYPVTAIGIESVAYQSAAVNEALRRSLLPVRPLRPDKDKVTRARLLEARAAAGKVYRPAAAVPWWPDMAAELSYFPIGAHDDIVDALAYALLMAKSGSVRTPVAGPPRQAFVAR